MPLNDNAVVIPENALEPAKSVLTYHFVGGEWAVSPRELATWFEHIGDLVDAGLPGSKIQNITFDGRKILVELR